MMPSILYKNLAASITVTAGSYIPRDGRDINDCLKPWPHLTSRFAANTTGTLSVSIACTEDIDMIGLYGHNIHQLASDTTRINFGSNNWWPDLRRVEPSSQDQAKSQAMIDGSPFVLAAPLPISATPNTTIIMLGLPPNAIVEFGTLYMGRRLELPRRPAAGSYASPRHSMIPNVQGEYSRHGDPVATAIEYEDAEFKMSMPNVEGTFVRDDWLPFMRACGRSLPAFFALNGDDPDADVAWLHSIKFDPSTRNTDGLWDIGFTSRARA